jgi:leader peptidase (prepilin peptidase)/N-methyltransferase
MGATVPEADPLLRGALGLVLGLVVGSFLATLVVRWPAARGLAGRSACDGCGARLRAAELVPLLSALVQGGRCRHCGARIDPVHAAVEAGCGATGAVALALVPGPEGLAGAALGWGLVALAALDGRHFWLPDALTLPLLALGLIAGPAALPDRFLGAAAAGGVLLALLLGYRAIRGREGLGLGDVKLGAALGAWLSPVLLPPLFLLASLGGLAVAAFRRGSGPVGGGDRPVPFGTCLALAGWPLWLLLASDGCPGG